MKDLLRFRFENAPWEPPWWTALIVGYAVLGFDGQMYLSSEGQDYLDHLANEAAEVPIGHHEAEIVSA